MCLRADLDMKTMPYLVAALLLGTPALRPARFTVESWLKEIERQTQ